MDKVEGWIKSTLYNPLISITAINKNPREATPFPYMSPWNGLLADPV